MKQVIKETFEYSSLAGIIIIVSLVVTETILPTTTVLAALILCVVTLAVSGERS